MSKPSDPVPAPEDISAAEFIACLLPPSPADPKLNDICTVVSSPWTPPGEARATWPPLTYHEGASYSSELYVNWATCRVIEYHNHKDVLKTGPRATNAAFVGQWFLMLDDIGNKKKSPLSLDDPRVRQATYLMETSAGNYQVGYAFAKALSADQNARLRAACIDANLSDAGAMQTPHRWCRVPGSVNMKPERKGFRSVLRMWEPEREFTLDELCKLLDIKLDAKIKASVYSSFDMPDDVEKYNDVNFKWLRTIPKGEHGSLIGGRSSTGFFPLICPWWEEHTQGKDGAGYRPGFEDNAPAFKCHHSHGDAISTGDFIDWCFKARSPKKAEPVAVSTVPVEASEFWNFDEASSAPFPDWLVFGLFARRQVGALFGEPYTGKSTLAFSFAMALAGGAQTLGDLDQWESDVGVVYFALEGNLRTRTQPYVKEKLLTHEPRVHFERSLQITLDKEGVINMPLVHECVAQAKELDPEVALVVIDTVARASLVDENSAALGSIVEALRVIAEMHDVCVLLVHHSGKDQSKGLRGHSSFYAALDYAIEVNVEPDAQGKVVRRTLTVNKQREGEGALVREFEIKGVELGRHPKRPQHVVTGPLGTVKAGDAKPIMPGADRPKGKNQKVAYDVLCRMVAKATRSPLARRTIKGWGVPTGELLDAVADKIPKAKGKHDRSAEIAKQALTAMVDVWVWFAEEGEDQYCIPAKWVDQEK